MEEAQLDMDPLLCPFAGVLAQVILTATALFFVRVLPERHASLENTIVVPILFCAFETVGHLGGLRETLAGISGNRQ
jgi:hypothetical protein